MKFLTEQKIVYLKQFGFRKNFSTLHAIINLVDSIENAFDKNKFAEFLLTSRKHLTQLIMRSY